jgi:hypothetical protein
MSALRRRRLPKDDASAIESDGNGRSERMRQTIRAK